MLFLLIVYYDDYKSRIQRIYKNKSKKHGGGGLLKKDMRHIFSANSIKKGRYFDELLLVSQLLIVINYPS